MNLIVKCYQDDSQLHYERLYNNDLMYYFDPCKHGYSHCNWLAY